MHDSVNDLCFILHDQRVQQREWGWAGSRYDRRDVRRGRKRMCHCQRRDSGECVRRMTCVRTLWLHARTNWISLTSNQMPDSGLAFGSVALDNGPKASRLRTWLPDTIRRVCSLQSVVTTHQNSRVTTSRRILIINLAFASVVLI